jgi:tetratricopeptide (TPR) repeat protein
MNTRTSISARFACLVGVAWLAAFTSGSAIAQARQPMTPEAFIMAVRTQLAHGALEDARKLTLRPDAPARGKAVGAALVAMYEGKDDDARRLLQPLVGVDDRDDAALELALLDTRHGRTDDAKPVLDRLMQVTGDMSTDDYFRLARAARAAGEVRLANDAYQRIGASAPERADIQEGWAQVFFEGHTLKEAAKSYQDALTADAAWIPAYVGLARTLEDDAPDEAAAALTKAHELAPKDPDVWLLTAERELDQDNLDKAKDALDHVALVRAGSLEELSFRAALAYSEGRTGDVDALVGRAQAVNPKSAEPYRVLAHRAAGMYNSDQAAAFAAKAVAANEIDADAQADLGLFLLRTGDEVEGRVHLERAFQLDSFNQQTYFLLTMLDNVARFTVVPDGEITFKFPADEAAVLEPYALPLAKEAYATFKEHYGFTPAGPVLVEIFQKHDDFAVRTTGLPGIVGALGACFGRVVTMDSPTARQPLDFSWQATLWHELAHVFTLQLSKYRVPRWLTEGISVFEEHRRNPAWGREMTLQYAQMLGVGQTFGVKGLAKGFKDPRRLSLAYFEASLVVEHLVNLGGDQALRTLLLAYADGATDTDAFGKAFGKNLDEVEVSYNAFIESRYGALRDAMKNPPTKVDAADLPGLKARAAAAPGNYISQLSLGQALDDAQSADARAVLERAAALAPQATGKESPHALLAEIATREGDPVRARRELRALLTFDHDNVEEARKLSDLAVEANAANAPNAMDDEKFSLQLVVDLDPFDAKAHTLLGRLALKGHDHAKAIVEFTAALGLGPANLAEAHTDLGEALLAAGKRDEAKHEALTALQEAPTYARAQDLLLAAIGKGLR